MTRPETYPTTKEATIRINSIVDTNTVTKDTIFVEDSNDKRQLVQFTAENEKIILVRRHNTLRAIVIQ